jgi:hypothetical protein
MSKLPQLSDEDLEAAVEAKEIYLDLLDGKKPDKTADIFYAGFNFGLRYARGDLAPTAPAPADDSDEL